MNIAVRFHAENLGSLSTNLRKSKSNVLLINDHKFSKKDIVQFVEELSVSYRLTKTILYTRSFDKKYLERILDSGTKGILHKNDTPLPSSSIKIFNAISAVNNGINCFDPVIRNVILKHAWAKGNDEFLVPGKPGIEVIPIKFSARETEIIRLIAQGKRSREIADEINISVSTLDQHKNHIGKKLHLKSARDILKYILNHKIEWD